jgi:hypothetical protein
LLIWLALFVIVDDSGYLLALGSAPVAFLWLSGFVLAIACVLKALDKLRSRLSSWFAPFVGVAVVVLLLLTREKGGVEKLDNPIPYASSTAEDPGQSQQNASASDSAKPRGPKIAIHADGGGLRAALFTAEVLAIADDLTCGEFGEHVAAASGVSGGSLGIATWVVMREELVRANVPLEDPNSWATCKEERKNAPKGALMYGARPLWTLVNATLLQDHLSMPLATMLTLDFVRPRGNAQRGQALLDSWQGSAISILGQLLGPGERRAFAADLAHVTAGLPKAPLLMFTATDVDGGGRVVFSNAKWAPHPGPLPLPIGKAALHSARFPVISPAGSVYIDEKWRRVADGGYFDNSGADTLRDFLVEARKNGELPEKVTIARVDGNPADSTSDLRCETFSKTLRDQGWLFSGLLAQYNASQAVAPQSEKSPPPDHGGWSPLSTYMATRDAHAEDAVKALSLAGFPHIVENVLEPLQLDYSDGFNPNYKIPKNDTKANKSFTDLPKCVQKNLQVCAAASYWRRAPLGWMLSRGASFPLDLSATTAAKRLVAAAGLTVTDVPESPDQQEGCDSPATPSP